jgi:hypothetical protein
MSILSNVFASEDPASDGAQVAPPPTPVLPEGEASSAGAEAGDDAQVAPPPTPELPGDEVGG